MRLKPLYYKHLDPSFSLDWRNLRGARNLAFIADATKASAKHPVWRAACSFPAGLCLMRILFFWVAAYSCIVPLASCESACVDHGVGCAARHA